MIYRGRALEEYSGDEDIYRMPRGVEKVWINVGNVAVAIERLGSGTDERVSVSAWPNGNEYLENKLAGLEVSALEAFRAGGVDADGPYDDVPANDEYEEDEDADAGAE